MQGETRFMSTYIALVALAWNALERVDQQLQAGLDATTVPYVQPQLQLLRLELLLLADKSQSCAGSRLVSVSQNVLVQRFVARLLAWLDFDATAAPLVARMRIRSAQNWLFDEAAQAKAAQTDDRDIRHG
jgi:hypothetical protein